MAPSSPSTTAKTGTVVASDRVRRVIYTVAAVGSILLGAVQVGYGAAEVEQPVWLTVSLAVWSFLMGGQGLLSLVNTGSGEPAEPSAE